MSFYSKICKHFMRVPIMNQKYIEYSKLFEKENRDATWVYGVFQNLIETH